VVIDDAHLLDDDEIEQLVDRVADPASTIVVATEPLVHRSALRALATTIERENPIVSFGIAIAAGYLLSRLLSSR